MPIVSRACLSPGLSTWVLDSPVRWGRYRGLPALSIYPEWAREMRRPPRRLTCPSGRKGAGVLSAAGRRWDVADPTFDRRLGEYEQLVADLQEQVKSLEEETVTLRRKLQDAPKRVRTLEERLLETK